ncbi:hypothetical protein BMS3Bbin05_00415 [bacterium BMS3Bbin05]|nr:hypothetical protein BMS3Bbin05_00415 [bacterium BMS3Bbin05]
MIYKIHGFARALIMNIQKISLINEEAIINRKEYILLVFAAILFIVYPVNAHADKTSIACIVCHESLGGELAKPVSSWKGSVHQQNGITCDYCHGGDTSVNLGNIKELSQEQFAAKQALAMSKSHGFIGKPVGKAMFDMCRQCHSASVERYENSIMGKAYLGNKGGPSCVVCHNAHNNTMPDVTKVCERCHKDTTGFDRIDPMDVNETTINELSGIRIKLAERKAKGSEPSFLPEFPEELGSFQIGFVAFGAVIVLFIIGYIIYMILEKRR